MNFSRLFDSAPPDIQNRALAELNSYKKKMPQYIKDKIDTDYKSDLLNEIVKSYIVANEYRPERKENE